MDNPNNISYADDWKQAYNPVYYEKPDETADEDLKDNNKKKVKTKKKSLPESKPLLIIIQIIICLIMLASAYALKVFGGNLYTQVHNWYVEKLNDEIIMTEDFESFSLDNIINFFNADKT